MKKLFYLLLWAIPLLFVCSCGSDSDEVEVPPVQDEIVFEKGFDADLTVDSRQAAQQVRFVAKTPWSTSISESGEGWLSVEPASGGVGDQVISIKMKPNETPEPRTGEISLLPQSETRAAGKSYVIAVTQAGKNTIVLDKHEFMVGPAGGEVSVAVSHNVDFDVRVDVPWIQRSDERDMERSEMVFRVDSNAAVEPREAKVLFVSKDGNLSEEVWIRQMQQGALVVAKSEYVLPEEGGRITVSVGHNVAFETSISADWVTLASPETREVFVTDELSFNVAPNESQERFCTVSFVEKNTVPGVIPLTQNVIIRQEAKSEKLEIKVMGYNPDTGTLDQDITGTPCLNFNSIKQRFEVEVTANNAYRVEIVRDKVPLENLPPYAADGKYEWFEHQKMIDEKPAPDSKSVETFFMDYNGGNGETYVPIERHVEVRFISESGNLVRTLRIRQTPAVVVQFDPTKPVEVAAEGGMVEIPFQNNSATPEDFEVQIVDCNWVRWIQPEKTRNAMQTVTFKLQVDANPDIYTRKARIEVRMKKDQGAVNILTLTQKGKRDIRISSDSLYFSHSAQPDFQLQILSSAGDGYTVVQPEETKAWLHVTKESVGKVDENTGVSVRTIHYSLDENNTEECREAIIKVQHSEFPKQLKIVQDLEGKLIVDGEKQFSISRRGGEIRIPIQRNMAYRLLTSEDWIEWIQPTRSMMADTVIVRIKPNDTQYARNGSFALKPLDNTAAEFARIIVNQEKGLAPEEQKIYGFLEEFYRQTDGAHWKNNTNWLTDAPYDDWYGVSSYNGPGGQKLLVLDLPSLGLKGDIVIRDCDVLGSLYVNDAYSTVRSITVENCTNLKQLYFSGKEPTSLEAPQIPLQKAVVKNCPLLNELGFSNATLNDITFDQLPLLNRLNLSHTDIQDFTALAQVFPTIILLWAARCAKMTVADVSPAKNLQLLHLDGNVRLASINTSGCTALSEMRISDCPVTSLDLSTNTALWSLYMDRAGLKELDITKTMINSLGLADNNQLKKVVATGARNLASIYVHGQLPLLEIEAADIPTLKKVIIGTRNMTAHNNAHRINDIRLNVSGCPALYDLQVGEMDGYQGVDYGMLDNYTLTTLNASGCSELRELRINGPASGLDLSQHPKLEVLFLRKFGAATMDLSAFKQLKRLEVRHSLIQNITCKDLPLLAEVRMQDYINGEKQETEVDVLHLENCPKLRTLLTYDNKRISTVRLLDCPALEGIIDFSNAAVSTFETRGQFPNVESVSFVGALLGTLDITPFVNVTSVEFFDSKISELIYSGCTRLNSIRCMNSHMNQQFTREFYKYFHTESHTPKYKYERYTDSGGNTQVKVTTEPYGMWFPGEPESHEHRAPAGW